LETRKQISKTSIFGEEIATGRWMRMMMMMMLMVVERRIKKASGSFAIIGFLNH